MQHYHIEVSWQTLWKIVVFAAVIAVVYLAREVVGVLLVAIVLALGLDPIISFFEKLKIPRLLSTFIVFVLAVAIFVAAVYLIVPIMIVEVTGFLENFNDSISSLFGISIPAAALQTVNVSLSQALSVLSAANISITGAIGQIFNRLILLIATIIIAFYLTVEKGGPEQFLRVILPDTYERSVLTIFSRFRTKIRRWFSAQLGLSLIVGLLVWVGLALLGVRYALILGLLAAVFELVPIIGPIVTGAIGFLAALSDSLSLALWTAVLFTAIQQLENHILLPVVMGKAMKVHPVVVIGALLTGAHVAGFVGVLLSVPIAVMFQVVFDYLAELKNARTPSAP